MKRRVIRRMPLESIRFIQSWMDAVDAGLTLPEFCQLHGFTSNSVHSKRHHLRRRGVDLPYLEGMPPRRRGPYATSQDTPPVAVAAKPDVEECSSQSESQYTFEVFV